MNILIIFSKFLLLWSVKSSRIPNRSSSIKNISVSCEYRTTQYDEHLSVCGVGYPTDLLRRGNGNYIVCDLPENIIKENFVKITSIRFPDSRDAQLLNENTHMEKTLKLTVEDSFGLSSKSRTIPYGISNVVTNLNELIVEDLKLDFINRGNFIGFGKLKSLHLNRNGIKSIPLATFYDLTNLEELNIYGNQLTQLNENLFIKNLNLKKIYATSNGIKVLPAGIFRNNHKLTHIFFDYNGLNEIRVDFRKFLNIEEISFKAQNYSPKGCSAIFSSNSSNKRRILEIFQKEVNENCNP